MTFVRLGRYGAVLLGPTAKSEKMLLKDCTVLNDEMASSKHGTHREMHFCFGPCVTSQEDQHNGLQFTYEGRRNLKCCCYSNCQVNVFVVG